MKLSPTRLLALAVAFGLTTPASAQFTTATPLYNAARTFVPGQVYTPSPSWRASCSSAGWARLLMIDGTFYDIFASVGTGGEDGIGIIGVAATAPALPAAACTFTGLYYRRLEPALDR